MHQAVAQGDVQIGGIITITKDGQDLNLIPTTATLKEVHEQKTYVEVGNVRFPHNYFQVINVCTNAEFEAAIDELGLNSK